MAAGNEGNNFVRDGSMLPHHDIDTSTTPNSWKPKTAVVNLTTNPIKIDQSGNMIQLDYDLSGTPDTSSAPNSTYKQVVEGSDGKEYLLRSGAGWRENHDGTVSMHFRTNIAQALGQYQFVNMPVSITNPSDLITTITDSTGTSNLAEGDAIPVTASTHWYDTAYASNTNSTLAIGSRVSPSGGIHSGIVDVHVEGGKL